jgi:Mrp family chromosome partitioning ATPase
VVRAGETPRESVQQAIKMLQTDKIIGVVLNDMEFKSSALHSRYFGTNRYYYKYGYSQRNETPNIQEQIISGLKKPKELFKRKK